jgi:hypothetical protein
MPARITGIVVSFFLTIAAPGQRPELVPHGFEGQQIESETAFANAWARENDWKDTVQALSSYLRTEMTIRNKSLGFLRLCRLTNPGLPRGGEQTLVLLQKNNQGLFLFNPLTTQYPATPEYKQTVLGKKMNTTGGGKILWIEILEENQEQTREGDTTRVTTQLYGYAFGVGRTAAMECLAYRIPISVKQLMNGNLQESSALQIRFSGSEQMQITKATSAVTHEQEQWIGTYRLQR